MMDRRSFLAAAGCAVARGALGSAAARAAPPLTSDVGPLRRVLVCRPAAWPHADIHPEDRLRHGRAGFIEPREGDDPAPQHRQFTAQIAARGAEVLELRELLDEALHEAAHAHALHPWLLANFPEWAGHEPELTAARLIRAEPAPPEVEARSGPRVSPWGCMLFTRDLAAMTPRGLVLAHFLNRDRATEVELLRFALAWSPRLRDLPIALDAAVERAFLQGGDLMVLDERTLLLGVGNLTHPAAAPLLARRLRMDVLSVRLPGDGAVGDDIDPARWNPLRTLFLHLDSVLTPVDRRAVVAAPYFLEEQYADRASLRMLACHLRNILGESVGHGRALREAGRVRLHRAGSAEPEPLRGKLVDVLRRRGYEVRYAGGEPPRAIDEDYLRDRAVPELLGQGANVVATRPGEVLAYAENDHSVRELTKSGAAVRPVPGKDLARRHGGPHCLTLPLERAP